MDPGLVSSCETDNIMERYFNIVSDFSNAIDLVTHTLMHKTNKTTSTFTDLAVMF